MGCIRWDIVKGGEERRRRKNEDGVLATVSWMSRSTAPPNTRRTYKDV